MAEFNLSAYSTSSSHSPSFTLLLLCSNKKVLLTEPSEEAFTSCALPGIISTSSAGMVPLAVALSHAILRVQLSVPILRNAISNKNFYSPFHHQ